MNRYLFIFLYSLLFLLYANVLTLYLESKFIYTLFTLIYFGLLFSALYKPMSYGYLFLSIFLFLGMWLKLTLHLLFNYAYIEPIGSFYSEHASMDKVLIVSIVGALGIMSVNILSRYLQLSTTIYTYENYIVPKPLFYNFYTRHKMYIHVIIFFSSLVLVYLNIKYAIQLSGIVPKTILIYPLNALIYWIIGSGFSILLIVLFSLDVKFKNILELKYLVLLAVITGITSIGLLSRGQYVFVIGSVISFLLFNYKNLNNFSIYKIIFYVFFVGVLYLFVIEAVTLLRGIYFSGASFSGASLSGASLSGALNKILHLAVDRWVGLEGIMAVSSYEHKSFELFFQALTTKAEIGKIDIYQYISNAHYKDMDNTKFAFATIPGSIAFLFYTNSLLFVYFGMFILVLIMVLIEYSLYKWYKSPLLTALIGMYLANAIAQFGLMPINVLKSMFFTFSFLLLFKLLEIRKIKWLS